MGVDGGTAFDGSIWCASCLPPSVCLDEAEVIFVRTQGYRRHCGVTRRAIIIIFCFVLFPVHHQLSSPSITLALNRVSQCSLTSRPLAALGTASTALATGYLIVRRLKALPPSPPPRHSPLPAHHGWLGPPGRRTWRLDEACFSSPLSRRSCGCSGPALHALRRRRRPLGMRQAPQRRAEGRVLGKTAHRHRSCGWTHCSACPASAAGDSVVTTHAGTVTTASHWLCKLFDISRIVPCPAMIYYILVFLLHVLPPPVQRWSLLAPFAC